MASLNIVTLLGRVGKEPDIRNFQSGSKLASFTLATTETWKDKSGNNKESTQWHNISVWGGNAAVVEDNVHKGDQVLVIGKVTYEEWTDKDGHKRQTTKIIADKIFLLSKKDATKPSVPATDIIEPELEIIEPELEDDDLPF